MRIFFLITFVIAFAQFSSAQKKVSIHLKDGSVISGKIMGLTTSEFLKVRTGQNLLAFPRADVDTILFKRERKSAMEQVEVPWFFKVDGGFLPGNSENEEDAPRFFHGSFNYGLIGNVYAGAGSGVEYYLEQTFVPVFANFEYKFRQTRFSPHIFFKAGYIIPGEVQQPSELYDSNDSRNLPPKYLKARGGVLFNPGFGFTSMLGGNFGFSLAMGFRHHILSYTGKDEYELEQRYNRLTLSLGLIFK